MAMPAPIKDKLTKYKAFWANSPVDRPLIGFSLGGWFPLQSYSTMQRFRGEGALTPDKLDPEEFFPDYDRIVSQWDTVEDDILRAVAPIPPFPWLEAMLGTPVRIGEESIWAEEGGFDYSSLDSLDVSQDNPWRQKYLEFVAALTERYGDRCPVGQPILRGVSDMIAALRGASQMVLDLYDRPGDFQRLARLCADILIGLVREQQTIAKPFGGGYEVEQLSLWAPGKIIRIQEDASALLSPELYVTYVQGEDRRLTDAFDYSVIHLHSSSLFLLERILDVESLKCVQINKDVGGSAVQEMLPFFRMVQARGRRLLIRGKLDHDDLELLRHNLSPNGLYLQIVVESAQDATRLREFFRPWA